MFSGTEFLFEFVGASRLLEVCIKVTETQDDIIGKLSKIPSINIESNILEEAFKEVISEFRKLGASDKVAKGSILLKYLLSQ